MIRLLAGSLVILGLAGRADANLIANGGFEVPAVTDPSEFLDLSPGAEPPGFAWSVIAGTVDVVHEGAFYASMAFEGDQFLDLDGFSPGAIAQTFATTPGTTYLLSFAYANNPNLFSTIPAVASVRIQDTLSSADLITPFAIVHGSSTVAAPDWTASGPISFVAQGPFSTLLFLSGDTSPFSVGGIFLDDVTIVAVPEPASLILVGIGATGLLLSSWNRRRTG